jgi:hypothetical protein
MWWILAAIAGLVLLGKAKASATPEAQAQPQTRFLPVPGSNIRNVNENPINRGPSLNFFGGSPVTSPVGGPVLLYPKNPAAPAAPAGPSGSGGGSPTGGISGTYTGGLTILGARRTL